jgi:hypothetical protein
LEKDVKKMKEINEILDYLYERHYQNPTESDVTSSHWKEVGSHSVTKTENSYDIIGRGFGNYRENNLLNNIKFLMETIGAKSIIKKFNHNPTILKAAKKICKEQNHYFEFDSIKQVLSLSLIEKYFIDTKQKQFPKTVCIIGDGYGFLGQLIKSCFPETQIFSVNLGKTLLFDVSYTSKIFNKKSYSLLTTNDLSPCDDFNFIEAEEYHLLKELNIELFINIASMQEMNNQTINNYFSFIEQSKHEIKYFYCCNRVSKRLPDGEITEIDKYPWKNWDVKVNELCPWYQKYPYAAPPFWKSFDGPIKHNISKYDR